MSDVRRTLHAAFSFVRGVERARAAGGYTLEHALEEHLTTLSARTRALDTLERRLADVVRGIEQHEEKGLPLTWVGIYEEDR